jgi:hypothetical protein
MFDPRDDTRDHDGRGEGRARVYDERDRDDDPREGLMHDLDLPRCEERELVAVRDRVYELDGEDSRTPGRRRHGSPLSGGAASAIACFIRYWPSSGFQGLGGTPSDTRG